MARAFLDACVEQGIDLNPDLNGERATGAAFLPVSQRHGRRSSTGNTYFARAARQPGLHHATNALATRILVEGNRATGVDVVVHGAPRRIRASREVIVSAGAVHTPQLLMLSGIGPADMLHGLGIPVVADRPAVGQSLQDQLRVPVAYRHRNGSPARLDRLLVGGAAYLLARRGLLASNVCDAGAVIDTGGSGIPDVRLVFRWHVFPESGLPLVDLEVTMLTPASRGRVTINSTNPHDEPVVDPAYLSAPDDLAILERGIAWARRIAGARAMRAAGIEGEYAPGDATIIDHVRHHAASAFHPVGTCRMGHDPDSVVDPGLRVRGIDGLRVVDASVIPSCVAGNAQASVMAVAEKAADLVTGVLPA
jgi:choline dehydrogenase-like flavoprotein